MADESGEDRDELQREVIALRQRVSDLQQRVARYRDGRAPAPAPATPLSVREELLVETERIAHVGSWLWNIEEDQVFWSDEMYRILGYDPHRDASTAAG